MTFHPSADFGKQIYSQAIRALFEIPDLPV